MVWCIVVLDKEIERTKVTGGLVARRVLESSGEMMNALVVDNPTVRVWTVHCRVTSSHSEQEHNNMTTMKIKYTDELLRSDWKTLDDVNTQYSEEEIVEMVQRYLDTQKHAIKYRVTAAERQKLMKSRLAELELKVKNLATE